MRYLDGPAKRRPRNEAEGLLYDLMTEKGWEATKRGWPDFFCIRDRDGQPEVCVIEVKPVSSEELSSSQSLVMRALVSFGVPCFMFSPDAGLQRVGLEGSGVSPTDDEETSESGNDGRLAAKIIDIPKIGDITAEHLKTARAILALYEPSYGEKWVFGVIGEVHQWCESVAGTAKLSNYRDGHRFLLAWFKRAKKWYKPRPESLDTEKFKKLDF